MNVKDKEKSLLEIAVDVVSSHKKPQTIFQVAKEAMQIKGLKTAQGQELLARFICDFMESGYFVYVGDGLWDLKERQPLSVIDRDVNDNYIGDDDPDIASSELGAEEEDEENENKDKTEDIEDVEPESEEDEISSILNESDDYNVAPEDPTEIRPEEDVELGYEEEDEEDEKDD